MNTHDTWNYSDCCLNTTNADYALRFIKGESVKDYHGNSFDEDQLKNYTLEFVKNLIYGLTVAQLKESDKLGFTAVDALISKHQSHWLKEYHDSVAFSEKHKGMEDWEKYCNPVKCIGTFTLSNDVVTVTIPDFV